MKKEAQPPYFADLCDKRKTILNISKKAPKTSRYFLFIQLFLSQFNYESSLKGQMPGQLLSPSIVTLPLLGTAQCRSFELARLLPIGRAINITYKIVFG